MRTPTVYSSTHPDVTAAWAALQDRMRLFHADVAAFKAQHPGRDAFSVLTATGKRIAGLAGTDSPGDLWRRDTRRGLWVPNERTAAGKALAKSLPWVHIGALPGMPLDVMGPDCRVFSPGMTAHDGTVWVHWSPDARPEAIENTVAFDASMWERAKPSAYYAMLEEREVAA